MKVITGVDVWTNNGIFIEDGYVVFDNNEIKSVGKGRPEIDAETFHYPGMLLMPGLVNAHSHIYSTLSRGMPLSMFNPSSFTELLEQLWWKLDKVLSLQDIQISAAISAIESLKAGVTTIIDHHSSPTAIKGSLNLISDTVNNIGMRCATCYEISDRDGFEARNAGIRENIEFSSSHNEMKAGFLGLHASFTLSDETLKIIARDTEGLLPLHVHVAEGPEDEEQSVSIYDKRIIRRFYEAGLMSPNSIYAHCIHINDEEAELIRETGGNIVVNAQSNANNGVGTSYWPGFLDGGLNVGLGNDGYGFNIAHDVRFFILSPHAYKLDPRVSSAGSLQNTLFKTNYEMASAAFGRKLGKIKPGYAADFILLDYSSPTPINNGNFMEHFFFGIAEKMDVRNVFVNGNHVLKDGKILNVDEINVYSASKEIAQRMWEKL